MGVLNSLPENLENDRLAGIKANSKHVQDNFDALLSAVNSKIDIDGTIIPTANLSMGSHKITNVATPTASADVATKGYVDSADSTLSASCVKLTGNQTIAGTKTFSSTISGNISGSSASCTGNAATVTNGVYTTGNQTIGGTKTFSSTIQGNISGSSGSCTGNAATVTNGVYTTGNQTINGTKTFSASPLVPTVGTLTDNSTKAASTKFVLDMLKAIYPVDSIYIGTGTTCPLAALFGTWTRIDAGLALWTGNGSKGTGATVATSTTGATNKISASLPNIKGAFDVNSPYSDFTSGAFYKVTDFGSQGWDGWATGGRSYAFDASRSSNVYSDSATTVQPPAYVVNVWRRTA